jgi:hypothetical protein
MTRHSEILGEIANNLSSDDPGRDYRMVQRCPDGTVVTIGPGGYHSTRKPDGTLIEALRFRGVLVETRIEMPDGTVKWEYPDGSMMTIRPGAEIATIRRADGSEVIESLE